MKLIYLANYRLPTEKAHGIQIMKTCEALMAQGVDVELWLPRRRNPKFAGSDIFEFYNIRTTFPVRRLWCLDLIGPLDFMPGIGYTIQAKTFSWSVLWLLQKVRHHNTAVVYSRDFHSLMAARKLGIPYFYEAHTVSSSPKSYQLILFQQARGIVAISKNLAEEFKKFVKEERIIVAEDGVDLEVFTRELDKQQARLELGFPRTQKLVLYTGHLYEWKGAHILARAAESLAPDVAVFLVGGTDSDLKSFRKFLTDNRLARAKLLGQVPYEQIPRYLAAADILALPNSGKFEISRSHTSPLKLFEYMTSRRPIVASDLPSIREILDETTAIFFVPDDPISLARKIEAVLSDPELAERLAVNAARRVTAYSWEARARKIKDFIRLR